MGCTASRTTTELYAALPSGPMGGGQPVSGTAPQVIINLQMRTGTSKSMAAYAQEAARQIAQQLKLHGNFDFSF